MPGTLDDVDDRTLVREVVAADSATERAQLLETIELMSESLADVQLALEDRGWELLGDGTDPITRTTVRQAAKVARVMCAADPLIRRGAQLRTAYVWGTGVTVQAAQEDDAEQDVNAVVQAFWDDPANASTWSSSQAHEELERRYFTGGNVFHCLPTNPLTGRVQVRLMPADEIEDVVCNPEDAADPWFYKRVYAAVVVEAGYLPDSTRTRRETRTVYYPALGYWPQRRPTTINGVPVQWDMPVLHTYTNRPEDSQWGIGDAYAALPWARGYKDFLGDWAKLVKALSKIAYKATAKSKVGGAQVRTALTATEGVGQVGGTAIMAEGQTLEAVGKSGATIDSDSGRPLAAMVAAALDVPVTMLLGDPGVTGARATAETLDDPLQRMANLRRDFHATTIRRVLTHVVHQAVKAPQGPLKGTVKRDPVTGREVVELRGEQEITFDVDWASLTKSALKDQIEAIAKAHDTQLMPPLVVLRLLLLALEVENVDEVLADMTDADGQFIAPTDMLAAAQQQAAVAAGNVPPGQGGPQPDPANPQPPPAE
jgi:hypothetical protein